MIKLLSRFELAKQPAEFEHELINLATTLAFVAHHGQYRKDGCTPQILHPLAVQRLLAKARINNPKIHAASIVHDALEDCAPELREWLRDEIERNLGKDVLDMVELLTDTAPAEMDRAKRKALQLARISQAPWSVKVIKLADVVASIQEGPAPTWTPEYAAQYVKQRSSLVAKLAHVSTELTGLFAAALRQPVWQEAITASSLA